MSLPPRTPVERLSAIIQWLGHAVVTRGLCGLLDRKLVSDITDRLRFIRQRFARIAASVGDGRYVRRSVAAPQRRVAKPRRPDPLPRKFGWLWKLAPEVVGNRGQLENLFRDPAMAALMAAAPASLARPLRSLCHMLGLDPPDILALPAKPRPRRKTPPTAPKTPPPPPPQPQPPEWLRGLRRSLPQFSLPRARRSPKPA
jgi:hypothetical protein